MQDKSQNILQAIVAGGVAAMIVSVFVLNSNLNPALSKIDTTNNSPAPIMLNKDFVSEQDLIVAAVEKASPAVVSIIITKDVPVLERYYRELAPGFSIRIPQYRENGETEKKEIGGGSGFIATNDGYIVTNKHVVTQEEVEYTIFTNDGKEYRAEVVDRDTLNDIAILKIQAENLPFVTFGNSDELKVGQTAIAIGNPLLEFNNSVSVGVISGLSRSITAGDRLFGATELLQGVIQTDAAINPGNSGGPLLDINGKVIGVNVAVASAENIGFSIPSNLVQKIVESVKEHGRIVRPYLGVRYVTITPSIKEKNSLQVDYGALVVRGATVEDLAVIPGSPADKAGLSENDVILEVDKQKLDAKMSLGTIISSHNVGDEITLKVLHKGQEKELKVKLEEPLRMER